MATLTTNSAGGRRQQLSEDVAAYVRGLILSGEARPGTFLRTEPLAAAVGVSNTPVREGLLIVAGEGFVELVPRRGFVVADVSRQDIRDMFWVQAAMAGELARRAAEAITTEQLEQLSDIDDAHRAADEAGDHAATVDYGHQFHRAINLAAASPRMTLMLGGLVKQLPNRFYNDIEGHNEDTMAAHPKILAALRDRDGERSAELMRAHMMDGADELVRFLEAQGLWAE